MTLTSTPPPSTEDPNFELAHECDPPPRSDSARGSGLTSKVNRFIGLDAARGIALIGMFAVHTMAADTPDGDLSIAWALSSGKSSALFAILGGVGMAFMTGRTNPPRGAAWARAAATPLVRGVLILAIGLILGLVVSVEDADVILPYLGLMFAMSALLIPFRAVTLFALGFSWAIVAPIGSYLLRSQVSPAVSGNLTFEQLLTAPVDSFITLMLTGFFPVMTWMAYICIGMGIGRSDLSSRRVVAWILGIGVSLTVLTAAVTQLLVAVGLRERIAADVRGHMSLSTFTEYVVWGGSGSLPTDSPWWLGINAPHSGTPLDLLYTSGIAMTVIGLLLALSIAIGPMLHVLAAPGSMTLTLYSAHLLLLGPLRETPDFLHFLIQVTALTVFALAWSSRFRRGPLEWLVWRVTVLVTRGRSASRSGREVDPQRRTGRHRSRPTAG